MKLTPPSPPWHPRFVRFIRRHARLVTSGQTRRDRKARAKARRLLLARFPAMHLRSDLHRRGDR